MQKYLHIINFGIKSSEENDFHAITIITDGKGLLITIIVSPNPN